MNEKETKRDLTSERNYGVDLLRLAAMFMVLCLHIYGHGGVLGKLKQFSVKYEAAWLVECLCICCLNSYMLISGYVGIKGKYRYSNLALLWLRVLIYSVLITAVIKIIRPNAVSTGELLQSFFPVLFNRYWFFTAYFAVFLLIPILNTACFRLNKRQLGMVIIALLLFFSVLPTIFHLDPFNTNFGSGALWFSLVYLVGAYIRLYGLLTAWSGWKLSLLYLASSMLIWLFKLVLELATLRFLGEARIGNHLMVHVSPLVLSSAVSLLLLFRRLQFSDVTKRTLSKLTPLSFSVYLIHEHPLFRTHVMTRFSFLAELPLPLMLAGHLALVAGIYVLSLSADYLRESLFLHMKLGKRLRGLEEKVFGEIWDSFCGTV